MRATVRILALAALALLAGPAASAAGQALPPSLTTDTNYAFSGVVEHDFTPGVSRDDAHGAAIDTARDRHYAVGSTEGGGDDDLAVIARRSNGALDATFAEDGTLALDVAPGADDFGAAIVVLPDGRLRIAGVADLDAAVVGLLANGDVDPAFGGGDGIVTVDVGGNDEATALAADGTGVLAITGSTDGDTFVTVLEADGSPTAFGDAVRDGSGTGLDDGGVDVAWGARGPVALVEAGTAPLRSALLLAFTASGDDDSAFSGDGEQPLDAGGTDTTAGGLLAYGGRLWATGSVNVGTDIDAYLARVDGDGGNAQARRFDMRGGVFPSSQQVASAGRDLTLVPGEPDTLVAGGSVTTDRGAEVAAAAFNLLDGDLAALQATELVIPVEGQGAAVGVAGGPNGAVALTSSAVDFSLETGSGSNDTSIGMARVLVDAEKQCDLALAVVSPLELMMRGLAPSSVTLRATNGGKRACGGTIGVPARFAMAPASLATGKLAPGGSVTLTTSISYAPPLPADDTLQLTLSSPTDAAPGDNVARVHVLFFFCDLQLRRIETPRALAKEGARRYGFSVRNLGTAECEDARIAVRGSGRRALRTERFSVPAGQSVTDEIQVGLRRAARIGTRATIAFVAQATDDVQPSNNVAGARPRVVNVGDSSARRPTRGGKVFTGKAKGARRTKGVRRRTLKLDHVEIAVRRNGKGCLWLATADGGLRSVPKGLERTCDQPVWVRVRGTTEWRLRLREALPKGRYTLISRAVTRNGVPEGKFGFKDRNKVRFRIR